jgi:hypothetical protein
MLLSFNVFHQNPLKAKDELKMIHHINIYKFLRSQFCHLQLETFFCLKTIGDIDEELNNTHMIYLWKNISFSSTLCTNLLEVVESTI